MGGGRDFPSGVASPPPTDQMGKIGKISLRVINTIEFIVLSIVIMITITNLTCCVSFFEPTVGLLGSYLFSFIARIS